MSRYSDISISFYSPDLFLNNYIQLNNNSITRYVILFMKGKREVFFVGVVLYSVGLTASWPRHTCLVHLGPSDCGKRGQYFEVNDHAVAF